MHLEDSADQYETMQISFEGDSYFREYCQHGGKTYRSAILSKFLRHSGFRRAHNEPAGIDVEM
jgi:hypothetical protein